MLDPVWHHLVIRIPAPLFHRPAVPMETAIKLYFNCSTTPRCAIRLLMYLIWSHWLKPPQLWFLAHISVQKVAMEHPVGFCGFNGWALISQPCCPLTCCQCLTWLEHLESAWNHKIWLEPGHSVDLVSRFIPFGSHATGFISAPDTGSLEDECGVMKSVEEGWGWWRRVTARW